MTHKGSNMRNVQHMWAIKATMQTCVVKLIICRGCGKGSGNGSGPDAWDGWGYVWKAAGKLNTTHQVYLQRTPKMCPKMALDTDLYVPETGPSTVSRPIMKARQASSLAVVGAGKPASDIAVHAESGMSSSGSISSFSS